MAPWGSAQRRTANPVDVNPGALLLLIGGIVAVIVGIRGTQNAAGSLLTGRTSAGAALPAPAQPAPGPTGSTPSHSSVYDPSSSVPVGGSGKLY